MDAEALEDLLEVVLHREEAAIEDDRDLGIRLPLGDPVQHLRLTRGQVESLQEHVDGGFPGMFRGGMRQALP